MKRSIQTVVCLIIFFLMTGCAYISVQNPLDKDFNKTELGAKKGTSDFKSLLWLFAWGNAGTQAAADNGGITVINHADQKTFLLLGGLYVKRTTVVYGD